MPRYTSFQTCARGEQRAETVTGPNDGLMDTRMDKGWSAGKTFKKEGVPLDRLPPKFKVSLVESNS